MGHILPSGYQLSKKIDEEVNLVHQKILKLVGQRPFSISVDEASSKLLKCFGIVVHFINAESMEVQSAALNLTEVKEASTAIHVRGLTEEVVTKFGLSVDKIVRLVSDGASVMKAAFL